MDSYRYHGHYISNPGSTYGTRDEISGVRQEHDPVERIRKLILSHELANVARFKEFFFNGLFGKLLTGSTSSGVERPFLLKAENKSLRISTNLYLLLPIEATHNASHEPFSINWNGVNSCTSIVNILRNTSVFCAESGSSTCMEISSCRTNPSETESERSDLIHLAMTSVHTGRIYSVLEVMVVPLLRASLMLLLIQHH